MKTEFSYEDFDVCLYTNDAMQVAEIANEKLLEIKKAWLEELVKDAPVVSGIPLVDGSQKGYTQGIWQEGFTDSTDTHTARLVLIEGVKK